MDGYGQVPTPFKQAIRVPSPVKTGYRNVAFCPIPTFRESRFSGGIQCGQWKCLLWIIICSGRNRLKESSPCCSLVPKLCTQFDLSGCAVSFGCHDLF